MANTISMQDMRYLNLFSKITQVPTRFCFKYNDFIIFSVPRVLVSKAVGENGRNIRKLNEILGKKIKVVIQPKGVENAKDFLLSIISPTSFKELEVGDKEIIITAGSQNKAALIGRNRRRLIELQKIAKDSFNKDLRIV